MSIEKYIDKNLRRKYTWTYEVSMRFTWDNKKATTNFQKHGVSFEEASTVFSDPEAIRIYDPDHSENEDRYLLLGIASSLRMLVVSHCYRENEDSIRIISARKAKKREASTYERRKYHA